MDTRPNKLELLRAVEFFLTDTAIPKLQERDQFLARVAVNVIKIVLREIEFEEKHLAIERDAMGALLGALPPHPLSLSGAREENMETNRRLCDLIRAGEFDNEPKRSELIRCLKESTLGNLEINDPKLAERIREEWKGGDG